MFVTWDSIRPSMVAAFLVSPDKSIPDDMARQSTSENA
jgi:hypothetical protein